MLLQSQNQSVYIKKLLKTRSTSKLSAQNLISIILVISLASTNALLLPLSRTSTSQFYKNFKNFNRKAPTMTPTPTPTSLFLEIDSETGRWEPSGEHEEENNSKKRIVLIRHGCTYMNEYLALPGCEWGDPDFTDIFPEEKRDRYYRDSPLSPRGVKQAQMLQRRMEKEKSLLEELDLIVVSPLQRALQTTQIGLLPHLLSKSEMLDYPNNPNIRPKIPIIALPHAAERLYFISDLGTPARDLTTRYTWADFKTEIHETNEHQWWFTPSSSDAHEEWRPNDANQKYFCPGEPENQFNQRMNRLCNWLEKREEKSIALVCHWGVIRWLTGEEFDNCEMRVVEFDMIRKYAKVGLNA